MDRLFYCEATEGYPILFSGEVLNFRSQGRDPQGRSNLGGKRRSQGVMGAIIDRGRGSIEGDPAITEGAT